MKLEYLRELCIKHRSDPNYRLREILPEDFRAQALKSYERLPESQRTTVQKSWGKALTEAGVIIDTADQVHKDELKYEMMEARFLAQTNLFFLCHLLEKYRDTTYGTHEDICNDFFVQKDPTYFSLEAFANDYDQNRKRRLLLVPRNGFKSSMDLADCVQYTICYPEVTILVMTGTLPLATEFVGEIREHFEMTQTQEIDTKGKPIFKPRDMKDKHTGEFTSSMFQILFPEHCIIPGTGKLTEFQTPALIGAGDKEATVKAASIEQTLSGFHFGVLKLDDVVTNENSTTRTRIETVNKQISVNRGMLNPYGFVDVIGTWYDENDFYGETLKNEETRAVAKGLQHTIKGSIETGRFNSAVNVICYLRACWWPKKDAEGKLPEAMTKDDYEYWFPERLTWEWLTNEKDSDEWGFAIKYLNNPRQNNKVKFPKDLLLKRTIPHNQIPNQGVIVTTVDTAYSTKSWADYTVIMTALIYGGRYYIINMKRGRWNEYDLPREIAQVAYRWKPNNIAIEESVGVAWLQREIRREMVKLQISVPITLASLGKGSKQKNKAAKAKPVVRLLYDERMYFAQSCEGLMEIYNELELFTGTKDDQHDDIVSGISLIVEHFGSYANDVGSPYSQAVFVGDHLSRERHEMIHGLGKYAFQDDNPITQFQIQTGPQQFVGDGWADSDPLSDLFGP